FILEPEGPTIATDFARARVLVNAVPVLESEAWLQWSEQFRARMPEKIRETMAEEQSRLQADDPDRMKRIRDRLKEVMQLLRPRRFRRADQGQVRAGGPEIAGPPETSGAPDGQTPETTTKKRRRTGGRGIGAVLSDLDDQNG